MSFFNRFKLEFYQAFYWIGYFFITLAKNAQLDMPYPWWLVCLSDLLVMGIVYTIVLIFSRAYVRPVRGTLVLAITFLLYSLLYYGLIYMVLPGWGFKVYDEVDDFTWVVFFFSMFLFFQHAMVEAGLLASVYRTRAKEREKRELMEKHHQTEVQFLTAQMNPHENANALNIPYQMAVAAGDKKMIHTLLQVMRLFLYAPEKVGGMRGEVPLGEEMAQCERILWVNKQRFGNSFIRIDVPDALHHWLVPVASVSALLQNAFKYGVSWDEQAPIILEAWQADNRLTIRLRNKINPHKTGEPSTGIGNENIRQRLALLYGGESRLDAAEKPDGWYETTLTFTKS